MDEIIRNMHIKRDSPFPAIEMAADLKIYPAEMVEEYTTKYPKITNYLNIEPNPPLDEAISLYIQFFGDPPLNERELADEPTKDDIDFFEGISSIVSFQVPDIKVRSTRFVSFFRVLVVEFSELHFEHCTKSMGIQPMHCHCQNLETMRLCICRAAINH